MSVTVQSWVWQHSDTNGNDRLVLLAIADEADDDGSNAYPSMERLARKCRVNRGTVNRAIRRLEDAGELIVCRPAEYGRGKYNVYLVVMGRAGLTVADCNGLGMARNDTKEPRVTARNRAEPRAQTRPDPLTLRPRDQETTISVAANGDKGKRACPFPEPFIVNPAMREWAAATVPTIDVRAETEQFCDYHRARGKPGKDWVAAWRYWMRNAVKFQRGRNGNGLSPTQAKEARTAQAIANVLGDDQLQIGGSR